MALFRVAVYCAALLQAASAVSLAPADTDCSMLITEPLPLPQCYSGRHRVYAEADYGSCSAWRHAAVWVQGLGNATWTARMNDGVRADSFADWDAEHC